MGMLWIASDLTDADIAELRDRLNGTNRSLAGMLDTMSGYIPGSRDVSREIRERLKVVDVGGIEQCDECEFWTSVHNLDNGVCEDCLDDEDDCLDDEEDCLDDEDGDLDDEDDEDLFDDLDDEDDDEDDAGYDVDDLDD